MLITSFVSVLKIHSTQPLHNTNRMKWNGDWRWPQITATALRNEGKETSRALRDGGDGGDGGCLETAKSR